jgi:hypothetical protein
MVEIGITGFEKKLPQKGSFFVDKYPVFNVFTRFL